MSKYTIILKDQDEEILDSFSKQTGRKKSEIIRQATRDYIAAELQKPNILKALANFQAEIETIAAAAQKEATHGEGQEV